MKSKAPIQSQIATVVLRGSHEIKQVRTNSGETNAQLIARTKAARVVKRINTNPTLSGLKGELLQADKDIAELETDPFYRETPGRKAYARKWLAYHRRQRRELERLIRGMETQIKRRANGIVEAAAGLQALEYIGGKAKRSGLGRKPKYNPYSASGLTGERLQFWRRAIWRAQYHGASKTEAESFAKALLARVGYADDQSIAAEWRRWKENHKKKNPRKPNSRTRGSRDAFGVFHAENPQGKLLKLYHIYAGKENLGGVEAVSAAAAIQKIKDHPKVKGKTVRAKLVRRYQHRVNPAFDWHKVKRFNFTYAIPGGAWLEDVNGVRDWFSFSVIERHLGKTWLDRQLRKQGTQTGMWINVDPQPNPGSAKGARFWVSPAPTLRGWYVRKVIVEEDGSERDGGIFDNHKYPNKRAAKEDAKRLNDALKKKGLYIPGASIKRNNPSVTDLSRTFQGKVTGSVDQLYAADNAPANLARAGKLVFLKVAGRKFHLPGAMVSIAPNGKLWITGPGSLFETKARKGQMLDAGEVSHICYETAKAHIGNGKTFEYVHEFGEDGGKRPHLLIDHEGMPILRGGDYKIQAEGIVN